MSPEGRKLRSGSGLTWISAQEEHVSPTQGKKMPTEREKRLEFVGHSHRAKAQSFLRGVGKGTVQKPCLSRGRAECQIRV